MFDVKKAEKILPDLKGVKVKIVNPTKEMKEFEKLRDFGADVEIVNDTNTNSYIALSNGEVEIIYMAVPIQMEFEPFLRTLAYLVEGVQDLKRDLKIECKGELEVKVFVAPICPHCAQVVEALNKIAIANPNVKVKVIDVTLYPELGEKYGVTSAPTVVVGDVKLVGEYSTEELFDWVRKVLCGEDYRTEYYVTLLKEGRIDEVKADIDSDEKLLALVNVLEKPEIMARVGAIMVLEEICSDPEKLKIVKDRLVEMLERGETKEDNTIIQDVIYLLGKIGDKNDLKLLEKLKDKGEDIRDAVEEAIEEIMDRLEG